MTESQHDEVHYFINCRRRNCQCRDHGAIYGNGAFYDLNTTGRQANEALGLSVGQECVVATIAPDNQIVFKWYSFLRETLMRVDTETDCRVFFGNFLASEAFSKERAAQERVYSTFFDKNGNFKAGHSWLHSAVPREDRPTRRNRTVSFLPEEVLVAEFQEQVSRAYADSPERRRERLEKALKKPATVQVVRTEFRRNGDVVAEVMLRANGICEACGCSAPFVRTSDGTPYLEIHHVLPLADGGDDTVENAVALCPNCHRKKHFG